MTDNWAIQVSAKLPDGTMFNVRGDSPEAVIGDLAKLAAASGGIADSISVITAAGRAAQVANAPAQAAPAAPAAWTPPQGGQGSAQPAPAASQPGAAPVCPHGPREYKSGVKNGKSWAGWSCVAGRDSGCKMQWAN